jgi:Mrp family chromosome partitioning ATPase
MEPATYNQNLKVFSVGLLLRNRDEALIWRGPAKHGVIKQFLSMVDWGGLDYLVVDCPPGTGDEPLSVIQLLENADGAIIVTTPQDVALADVRKSITFCRQIKLPVIGVVENMSGFCCPHCGNAVDIFKSGGGKAMAENMEVPFLGRIPLDPAMVGSGDEGAPLVEFHAASPTAMAIRNVVSNITSSIAPIREVGQGVGA